MKPEELDRRRRVMVRSAALGHCVCEPRKPCPCDLFKEHGVCECAGERMPSTGQPFRLTEHVRSAGCGSKVPKADLEEILRGLPDVEDPRVVVGRKAGDDAGIIMLSEHTGTVLTVDVFAPSVDDPYEFGQIAAANSVSDIYAMAAEPQAALSIVGFPVHSMPRAAVRDILRGGFDKLKEAGISVIGGHSISTDDIFHGYAVLGHAEKGKWVQNSGACPGDIIVLTKPLGVGILAFGNQIGRTSEAWMREASASMRALNRRAGMLMARHGAHAGTDVTGFGLMGHLAEIAKNSGAELRLDFDALPLLSGAMDLAEQDVLPGALERNREAVPPQILRFEGLSPAQEALLFCPETSGGIAAFLPEGEAEAFLKELKEEWAIPCAVIGRVSGPHAGGKICVSTAKRAGKPAEPSSRKMPPTPRFRTETPLPQEERPACCASAAEGAVASGKKKSTEASDKALAMPEAVSDAFAAYMSAVSAPGAIGLKEKKLMALALSVLSKCEPCVKINLKAAREAGASEAELSEAVALAIAFGGAPAAMFYKTMGGA